MREALARTDHDFVYAEPHPKPKKASRRTVAAAAERSVRIAHRTAKYTSLVAGAIVAAVITGILVNALALQKARHPAPFFAKSVALPDDVETPAAAPVPVPAPRPASVQAEPVVDKPALLARPHTADAAAPAEAKPAPQRDLIAQLLKAPPPPQKQATTIVEPSKAVLAAQRALVKLGFVLKPDGVIGTTTRQAVEHFERDHGLPVRGELTPKLLHELSAQSGVAVE